MTDDPYNTVRDRLKLQKALPVTLDWSAAPDFVHYIVDHCLESRPSMILECSSGVTTLALARCCQMNRCGHVYSLENGEEFAQATSNNLIAFGLEQYATVLHAPLGDVTLHGVEYRWYNTRQLPAGGFDMLVIDGPPGKIQRHSRYPALPMLYDQLTDNCVVFMDDAGRNDEKEIIEMWLSEFPSVDHRYIELERGCSRLQRKQPG